MINILSPNFLTRIISKVAKDNRMGTRCTYFPYDYLKIPSMHPPGAPRKYRHQALYLPPRLPRTVPIPRVIIIHVINVLSESFGPITLGPP